MQRTHTHRYMKTTKIKMMKPKNHTVSQMTLEVTTTMINGKMMMTIEMILMIMKMNIVKCRKNTKAININRI